MKVEHLYQVMLAEITFHEILINGLSDYIAKKMSVSPEEIETYLDHYRSQETTKKYLQSVHQRTMKRLQELAASS